MSDLYADGEAVRCACKKCGWIGNAKAPRFTCGGCGRYMVSPLDRDKRRAEAAEARCVRLTELLREMTGWSDKQIEEGIKSTFGALSDTSPIDQEGNND